MTTATDRKSNERRSARYFSAAQKQSLRRRLAALVPRPRPRSALAALARSVPRVDQRDHAAADAGGHGPRLLRAVRRSASRRALVWRPPRSSRCCGCGKASATIAAHASFTPRPSRSSRSTAAQFPADVERAAEAARHRPLHGRRDRVDRLRPPGPDPRGEHDPPAEPADRLSRRSAVGAAGQRILWQVAEEILPQKDVAQFNQALMELGSLVCTPTEPKCRQCPLSLVVCGPRGRLAAANSAGENPANLHRAARGGGRRSQTRPRAHAAMRRRRTLGRPVGFSALRARSRWPAVCPRGNHGQSRRANRHRVCSPGRS